MYIYTYTLSTEHLNLILFLLIFIFILSPLLSMTLWRSFKLMAGKMTVFLLFCVQAKISVFNSYLIHFFFFLQDPQVRKTLNNLNLRHEIQTRN